MKIPTFFAPLLLLAPIIVRFLLIVDAVFLEIDECNISQP